MRLRLRLACSPLIALMGYAPGLVAQQQYCFSGSVTSAPGGEFKVGDAVAATIAIRPDTLLCTTTTPVDGATQTNCTAKFTVDVTSGTRRWTSNISGAAPVLGLLNATGISVPSAMLNTTGLLFAGAAAITPYPGGDSPGWLLNTIYREVTFDFKARMYLMWDPALPFGCTVNVNCSSIPVPFGYTSWGFSAIAQQDVTGQWTAYGSRYADNFQSGKDFPRWDRFITTAQLNAAACALYAPENTSRLIQSSFPKAQCAPGGCHYNSPSDATAISRKGAQNRHLQ